MVEGAIEVVTGTGKTVNRTMKAALCRCGQSANKPYCDGTHNKIGFLAP
jgi:CDGSH-type Zn-finger protein